MKIVIDLTHIGPDKTEIIGEWPQSEVERWHLGWNIARRLGRTFGDSEAYGYLRRWSLSGVLMRYTTTRAPKKFIDTVEEPWLRSDRND